MGAQVSEEVDRWVSVSDLVLISRKVRLISALPAECQVEALRFLWRSLRKVPRGTTLIEPGMVYENLIVVVHGEAQAVLGHSTYSVILPGGSFFCESALLGRGPIGTRARLNEPADMFELRRAAAAAALRLLRRWRGVPAGAPAGRPPRKQGIPNGALGIVASFLAPEEAPRFGARIVTNEPTWVALLSHEEFAQSLRKAEEPSSVPMLSQLQVACNLLENVTVVGAGQHELGVQDIAALRVVCEGPMNMSCSTMRPALQSVPRSLFGSCMAPPSIVE